VVDAFRIVEGRTSVLPMLAPEPVPEIAALATRIETPCGQGRMVWRSFGDGKPLVLLHGGTGSWRHWALNVIPLSRRYRVLAADLPGLGESALPPEGSTPRDVGEIVAAGISRIIGDAPYDIMGFSFGALISSQVATVHGGRVRSWTVVGPASLGLARHGTVLEKVRSKTGEERRAANRANLAKFMFADAAAIDERAVAIQDWNTVHARFKSKGFAGTTDVRDAIAAVPARVSAIWGSRDVTASPSLEARLDVLRAVRPETGIRVIAGAGHWVSYEAAAAFNAAAMQLIGGA